MRIDENDIAFAIILFILAVIVITIGVFKDEFLKLWDLIK